MPGAHAGSQVLVAAAQSLHAWPPAQTVSTLHSDLFHLVHVPSCCSSLLAAEHVRLHSYRALKLADMGWRAQYAVMLLVRRHGQH